MDDSILTSIKKLLGLADEYVCFDTDIIMHINTALMILHQLGVGPPEGFRITDKTSTWNDYLSDDITLESVKTYVGLKVRILFDPPQNSTVMDSMNREINMLEWRINTEVENRKGEST